MTQELYIELMKLGQRPFNLMETLSVLKVNPSIYWSWGVSKLIKIQNKGNEDVGLLLKVNGHHHKSWVLITLAWDDTYTVHIINRLGKTLNTYEQVYFDDLVEIIDNRIEKKADYQF